MKNTNSCESLWGYVVVASKFLVVFLDTGIAKSFGVLIPTMVKRFDSDYATVGLICSLPATLTYLIAPLIAFIVRKLNNRIVAMSGGILTGCSIAITAFTRSISLSGIFLTFSGIGFSMAFVPSMLAVNEYFPEEFVFMNTLTCYGYTAGSMLLPIITEWALLAYGYTGAFVFLGGITFHLVACGATFRKARRRDVAPIDTTIKQVEENNKTIHLYGGNKLDSDDNLDRNESARGNQKYRIIDKEDNHSQHDHPDETSSMAGPSGETQKRSCRFINERLFFVCLPIIFFTHYTMYAWMLFLIPHAKHLGISENRAVFLSTIGGIGGIIGRTFFLVLVRQGFNLFVVYAVVYGACALSFWLDFIGSAYLVRAILAFVQGFCFFIQDSVLAALCKYVLFDSDNFANAMTISLLVGGAGTSLAGLFTGYMFDVIHSFTTVFIIIGSIQTIILCFLIATIILLKKWHLP